MWDKLKLFINTNLPMLMLVFGASLFIGGGISAFYMRDTVKQKTTVDLTEEALTQLFNCMELAQGDSEACEDETYKAYNLLKQLDDEDKQKLINKYDEKNH